MKLYLRLLFVVFLLACFFTLPTSTLSAQEDTGSTQVGIPDSRCNPTDIVILIDQSESMAGSDRNKNRFEATQSIITALGNHAVWLCFEENIQHRIAIVGFGDRSVFSATGDGEGNPYQQDVEVYIDTAVFPSSTEYDDLKNSFTAWKEERSQLHQKINTEKQNNVYLGATDHKAAFEKAHEILSAWKEVPVGSLPRRQAVMLLTDGDPCLLNKGCTGNYEDYSLAKVNGDMELLAEYVDRDDIYFPFGGTNDLDNVVISIILLSSNRNTFERTLNAWNTIATQHGGAVFEVQNSSELGVTINDALRPIAGSGQEKIVCDQPFWVEPYTDDLIILYAFSLTDVGVQASISIDTGDESILIQGGEPVETPSSTTVQIEEYESDSGNEFYIFSPPVPGKYTMTTAGENCASELDIKFESAPIEAKLNRDYPNFPTQFPVVEEAPYYHESLQGQFQIEVGTADGKSLVELPGYPLDIQATITNGTHQQILNFVKQEDGVYVSEGFIETPIEGRYSWEIVGTVQNPNPEKPIIEVFKGDAFKGSFTAKPVTFVNFTVEPINPRQPLNTVNGTEQFPIQIPVTVNLTDLDGNPIDAPDVFNSVEGLFTAQLIHSSGVKETITLTMDATKESLFTGIFSNGTANRLYQSGGYTIKVLANWGGEENYNILEYGMAKGESDLVFEQYEIRPITLELIPPASPTLLHAQKNFVDMFLYQNGLEPFTVQAKLVDPLDATSTPILNEVLTNVQYEVTVQAPSGAVEKIILTQSLNPAEQLLIGQGGLTLEEEGSYKISLVATNDNLDPSYVWSQTVFETSFERQNTAYTNPFNWLIGQVILGAITTLIMIWLGYLFSGGPAGTLEVMVKRDVVYSGSLSKRRRVNKITGRSLLEHGIKSITVQKSRVPEAISIITTNVEGHNTPSELNPGDSDYVFDDVTVKYINPFAKQTTYDE